MNRTPTSYTIGRAMRPRTAIVSAAAAGLVWAMAGCSLQPNDHTLPGQTAVGSDGYSVTVTFDNVDNLVPNSNVQRDNVTIGTVAKIEIVDWRAEVSLRLLKDQPVDSNATFSIGQKTLLGAQYVEIADAPRPAGRRLADGAVVPVSQTGEYPQTEQVLGAASLLLNNGGLSQISTITGQLSKALDGRVPNTRGLVTRLDQLLDVLDENKYEIVRALEAFDGLSADLADQNVVLSRALRAIGPGLRTLNEQRQALITAVVRTGSLSARGSGVVASTEQAILNNLSAIRPALSRLGIVSSQLPEALKIAVTVPFPAMTSTNTISGDYANLFATLDLSVPTLIRNFGGVRLPASMQASDPIQGPLDSGSSTTASGTAGQGGSSGSTGSPAMPATPLPSSPTPAAPPKSCGLLVLLGAC